MAMSSAKKLVLVAILLIALVAYAKFLRRPSSPGAFKIGLVYLLQHPAIDQGIDGFRSELQKVQESTGATFDVTYSNAFGEPRNLNGIIAAFQREGVDAIVALTTPAAQVASRSVLDRPVIFVGVSDPVAAGLVDTVDRG